MTVHSEKNDPHELLQEIYQTFGIIEHKPEATSIQRKVLNTDKSVYVGAYDATRHNTA